MLNKVLLKILTTHYINTIARGIVTILEIAFDSNAVKFQSPINSQNKPFSAVVWQNQNYRSGLESTIKIVRNLNLRCICDRIHLM